MGKKKIIGVVILLGSFCLLLAGIPEVISHQGRLVNDAGVVLDGEFRMVFSLYDNSTGGNLLWAETQMTVPVKNGLYNVFLGSTNPFPDSLDFYDEYWLKIVVDGEPLGSRIALTTSPYAMTAGAISGILHINSGYHLGGDTVVVAGDTIAIPQIGDTFIDTAAAPPTKGCEDLDVLEIYLNGIWQSFYPIVK